jgi:hypothetical protein
MATAAAVQQHAHAAIRQLCLLDNTAMSMQQHMRLSSW